MESKKSKIPYGPTSWGIRLDGPWNTPVTIARNDDGKGVRVDHQAQPKQTNPSVMATTSVQ